MRRFIQRYFSSEIPEKEQMYHMFTLLSIVGFSVCFYMSMFFMMEAIVRILLLLSIFVSVVLFFTDVSDEKVMKRATICLYILHIWAYPTYYILAKGHPASAPIYFVTCLVLTAYLWDGWKRIFALLADVIIFLGAIFYVILVRFKNNGVDFEHLSQTDYIMIFIAVGLNGGVCSLIAYYKNRLIHDEIARNYEATEEARNAGYAKDIFLVNVSHDIRTPLNAIIGTCELSLDKEMNEEAQENMNQILNYSKALLSITNNLLDFSKLDENAIELKDEIYDTEGFMDEIINMFSVQLLDTGIEFYTEIDASIPKKLWGDSDKLRQIMVNLISNAVKYTTEGFITLRILNTPVDDHNCRITFEVSDTGIGIKQEEIKSIFEPFVRGSNVKDKVSGFGLGLSNSKVIAEAMRGYIKAESTYGEGSTFSVSVPQKIDVMEQIASLERGLYRVIIFEDDNRQANNLQFIFRQLKTSYTFVHSEEEFMEKIASKDVTHAFFGQNHLAFVRSHVTEDELKKKLILISKRNAGLQTAVGFPVLLRPIHVLNTVEAITGSRNIAKKRADRYSPFKCPEAKIMVVDDNQINLQVAGGMLEKLEAQVTTVLSGKECLKKLESESYDLVFMDYMMPEMDGIDTLKNMKKTGIPSIVSIPVVALTANAVSGSREMFLEAGFDEYISKPIDRKTFYGIVKTLIPEEKIVVE